MSARYHYEPATELTRDLRSASGDVLKSELQVSFGLPLPTDFEAWVGEVMRLAQLHNVPLSVNRYGSYDPYLWMNNLVRYYTQDSEKLSRLINSYAACRVTQAQHAKRMSARVSSMLSIIDEVRKLDHRVGSKLYGKPAAVSEFPL